MDCYIVRVYRHVTRKNGSDDEIAGLVERVGQQDSGKPFSSYTGLVNAMRDDSQVDPDKNSGKDRCTEADFHFIKSVRGS